MITKNAAASVVLAPTSSSRNIVQSPATNVRTMTVRGAAFQTSDLLRTENSDGSLAVRVGLGGLGQVAEESVITTSPNLVIRGTDSSGATPGGGYLGSKSADGAHEIYMQSITHVSTGAGPHLHLSTGIGRPATEYWYTEIVHKHNNKHIYTEGIESYSSTQKHFFSSVIPTDDGAGNLTFIYQSVIDWQTGRTIFHPGATVPATYTHLVDMRSEAAAVPVLRVIAASGQSADLQDWSNYLTGIESRINKAGYFMTRRTSAPADGDLVNSEVAFWLTDTPGSTSLRVKAKDSAGTVRNGTVALT